jgi:hypothetical protein
MPSVESFVVRRLMVALKRDYAEAGAMGSRAGRRRAYRTLQQAEPVLAWAYRRMAPARLAHEPYLSVRANSRRH